MTNTLKSWFSLPNATKASAILCTLQHQPQPDYRKHQQRTSSISHNFSISKLKMDRQIHQYQQNTNNCKHNHQKQQQQQWHQQQYYSHCNLLSLLVGLYIIHLCTDTAWANPLQQQQNQQQQQHQQKQLQTVTHTSTIRVQQCREGCLEKFTTTETKCRQQSDCLTCWDECNRTPPPKISKSIRETWSLHTVSMLQQDSLVLVDVAWEPLSLPNQCLVTWEVAGGGLMGNLLTESFNVQLSLWPDTKYRVQVTCKNKLTGLMSRSLPLTIDTSEAVKSLETHLPQIHPTLRKQAISSVITNIPIRAKLLITTLKPTTTSTAVQLPKHVNTNSASFDDKSEDNAINELHTNFILNWHKQENADISAIEPLNKSNLDVFTLTALSDIQKPLCYGLVLLTIILLSVCIMKQQRLANDKTALVDDEVHNKVTSTPVTDMMTVNNVVMASGDTCKNPANCSRYILKV